MFETVNEHVHVLASFNYNDGRVTAIPHLMRWRGRQYKLDVMGLHHPAARGKQHVHVFEFASGNSKFTVELQANTLEWILTEVYYDHSM